ncbi:MAG TPA: hypothetical protein VK588_01360 [Chitinophagaceae bacterium]|nr:hypothetical protein [Chitinophagaceae bacterium]
MTILRIEHVVPNFEGWRKAFDADPINRKKMGVKHYRIYRPIDDPNYVIIDLEFTDLKDARDTLLALRKLWDKVEGTVMVNPQTRILDIAESAGL